MIYGDGGPIAKLVNESGAVTATLTLARPIRREANGYEDVIVNLGTDADGNAIEDYQGVRYHGKYVWLSHADNATDISVVQRLRNWKKADLTVLLTPHSDEPQQQIRCTVTRASEKPVDGRVNAEEIMIELWGVDVLPNAPNILYDRICRVYGRGHVAA